MLYRLAGKPQILNPVSMLESHGLHLGGQATENFSGGFINAQNGLSFQPMESRLTLLADAQVGRVLGAEFQLCNSDRRNVNGIRAGEQRDIRRGQGASLDGHPDTGIDQEAQ